MGRPVAGLWTCFVVHIGWSVVGTVRRPAAWCWGGGRGRRPLAALSAAAAAAAASVQRDARRSAAQRAQDARVVGGKRSTRFPPPRAPYLVRAAVAGLHPVAPDIALRPQEALVLDALRELLRNAQRCWPICAAAAHGRGRHAAARAAAERARYDVESSLGYPLARRPREGRRQGVHLLGEEGVILIEC